MNKLILVAALAVSVSAVPHYGMDPSQQPITIEGITGYLSVKQEHLKPLLQTFDNAVGPIVEELGKNEIFMGLLKEAIVGLEKGARDLMVFPEAQKMQKDLFDCMGEAFKHLTVVFLDHEVDFNLITTNLLASKSCKALPKDASALMSVVNFAPFVDKAKDMLVDMAEQVQETITEEDIDRMKAFWEALKTKVNVQMKVFTDSLEVFGAEVKIEPQDAEMAQMMKDELDQVGHVVANVMENPDMVKSLLQWFSTVKQFSDKATGYLKENHEALVNAIEVIMQRINFKSMQQNGFDVRFNVRQMLEAEVDWAEVGKSADELFKDDNVKKALEDVKSFVMMTVDQLTQMAKEHPDQAELVTDLFTHAVQSMVVNPYAVFAPLE